MALRHVVPVLTFVAPNVACSFAGLHVVQVPTFGVQTSACFAAVQVDAFAVRPAVEVAAWHAPHFGCCTAASGVALHCSFLQVAAWWAGYAVAMLPACVLLYAPAAVESHCHGQTACYILVNGLHCYGLHYYAPQRQLCRAGHSLPNCQ